ncbi:REGULATOR OF CHROMOSOME CONDENSATION (CELL CYCLE REGULATORY PROTEIN)-RELATED [Salix purpurea]|uniref:REGULATOR OF CHROMOSOME CONDENSATION (CELL CYCLE REGULATORY PROTEIN)-RELATED n=1 Tax=Salix purpurea TaxID=77065 RepID=A0A9Q0SKQ8_SALPP|nr:REGULATOR OF CHROMOSOME CONDENSATION (CELL CYCLE REGULATORY PROTEIN)-RELATED [Salix purpurea]
MLRIRRVLEEKKLLNLIARSSRTRWMSSSTEVMSFGDGSHGALGLRTSLIGHGMDAYEPTPVTGLPSDITLVSAGHYHSLAVTSHGQLWAWGRNHEVQLGRGLLNTRDTWNEPKRVEGLDQVQVTAAFASGVVSAAIGDDGSLWVWGRSKRGQLGLGKGITEASVPSKVEALEGEKIAKVSFGWGHALALTVDGKLFGWGYLADGRLGKMGGLVEASPLDSSMNVAKHEVITQSTLEVAERLVLEGMEKEMDMPIVWDPCSVEELKGVEVVDIACGLDHSLVLCRDGTLLSSGSNTYGQLGRANHDIGLFPVDTSFPAAAIASGLGHSLAICRVKSSEGEGDATSIVSWGWNQSSQLGRPEPENVPMEVEGLAGETAILVSGGRAHSIAVTSKGEVWVWGCGRNGRLGLGSSCDEPEPVMLDSLEGCEVLQAVSGFDHNLILIAR